MGMTAAGKQATAPYVPDAAAVVAFLKNAAVYGRTERFDYLDRREAHWRGLQYDHQTLDWWGLNADQTETISPSVALPGGFEYALPEADPPVRQKRPTAPLHLGKAIPRRFTGMLFGEQRRPRINCQDDPDTEDWVRAVAEQAQFWTQMRSARNVGGAMGSVLETVHVREGRFAYEVHNPKNLTVIWKDRRTWTPLGVLKMYTHMVQRNGRDDKGRRIVEDVEMLYRRVITAWEDIVFKEVELRDGIDPPWEIDPQLYVRHDLGFFPGVWVQNTVDSEDMDGDADCEGAWGLMDTIDRLASQVNKGTLLNLDPTLVTKEEKRNRGLNGDEPIRKGSGHAIDLSEKGDAKYLEMSGTGIEVALKVLDWYEKRVLNLTQCVMLDPATISGAAMSAKAMEYVFGPMIERSDDFRAQYGAAARALLDMTIKIGRSFDGRPVDIGQNATTGDMEKGVFGFDLPPRVEGEGEAARTVPRRLGPGGNVTLAWGPYFAPTEQDEQLRITNAATAKREGLVRGETATKHVAQVFDFEDADQEYAQADEEASTRVAGDLARLDPGVTPDRVTPPGGIGGRP
jgi:hypothetical protein